MWVSLLMFLSKYFHIECLSNDNRRRRQGRRIATASEPKTQVGPSRKGGQRTKKDPKDQGKARPRKPAAGTGPRGRPKGEGKDQKGPKGPREPRPRADRKDQRAAKEGGGAPYCLLSRCFPGLAGHRKQWCSPLWNFQTLLITSLVLYEDCLEHAWLWAYCGVRHRAAVLSSLIQLLLHRPCKEGDGSLAQHLLLTLSGTTAPLLRVAFCRTSTIPVPLPSWRISPAPPLLVQGCFDHTINDCPNNYFRDANQCLPAWQTLAFLCVLGWGQGQSR